MITDIIMPESEGINTIVDILQENPKQKIVAISGGRPDGYPGYLETASALGASGTLAKPFSNDQLLKYVNGFLN